MRVRFSGKILECENWLGGLETERVRVESEGDIYNLIEFYFIVDFFFTKNKKTLYHVRETEELLTVFRIFLII